MTDNERVRDFQRKLYRKAKQEPKYRFYILYDKVRLLYFLREAYRRVRANKGTPGVDGVSFKQIEEEGLHDFLLNIQEELASRTYRPKPVKRVMIQKANGKQRPLGIPTIKDRVVQMSCKMVIEPIFEADFQDESYGFRPKRSAKQAINRIKANLKEGKTQVYDADLSAYFDNIPHDKLLILIGKRISDKNIIHLIKMWLKAPIDEDGKMSGGKKNKVGTPQGGVISPLLANIYLNLVDKIVQKDEVFFRGITIVRYADDFVLMGKRITAKNLERLKAILNRMELRMNEEKTDLINARKEPFNFLGFTIRYQRSKHGGYYWSIKASKKSFQTLVAKIRSCSKRTVNVHPKQVVKELNWILRGWMNYYLIRGTSYLGYTRGKITKYLRDRIYRTMKRKSQRYRESYCRRTYRIWVKKYGLINPDKFGMAAPVKA